MIILCAMLLVCGYDNWIDRHIMYGTWYAHHFRKIIVGSVIEMVEVVTIPPRRCIRVCADRSRDPMWYMSLFISIRWDCIQQCMAFINTG